MWFEFLKRKYPKIFKFHANSLCLATHARDFCWNTRL
jgi:hypothetical protein